MHKNPNDLWFPYEPPSFLKDASICNAEEKLALYYYGKGNKTDILTHPKHIEPLYRPYERTIPSFYWCNRLDPAPKQRDRVRRA